MRGDGGMRLFGTRLTLGGAIGLLIVLACAGSAILASWIAPHDPHLPMGQRWESPSPGHWLGLDQIGRDMLSRMLYGGRIAMLLAVVAAGLATIIGIVAGFAAANSRRWVDLLLSSLADVVLSMPILISALIVFSALGTQAPVLVATIGVLHAMIVFRVARDAAREILAQEFVAAARQRGEGSWWVIWHEVLPNALPQLGAEFGLRFGYAFLFVSALSFLGLGAPATETDWGGMVRESALAIPAGVAAPLYPAAAIALLAFGVNLVVGWLQSLQPRPHGNQT